MYYVPIKALALLKAGLAITLTTVARAHNSLVRPIVSLTEKGVNYHQAKYEKVKARAQEDVIALAQRMIEMEQRIPEITEAARQKALTSINKLKAI